MARLSSFFKYWANIFGQDFAVRKSVERKFRTVLFSWYFFNMLMPGIQ